MKNLIFFIALLLCTYIFCASKNYAQENTSKTTQNPNNFTQISGKLFDETTKEPLINASVLAGEKGTLSDVNGFFSLEISKNITEIKISYMGFQEKIISLQSLKDENKNPEKNPFENLEISLKEAENNLQGVVITASREAQDRTDAPVAISKINATMINDAKPSLIAELINKTPGVLMLNYNNEQHGMSIRQPMGTSAYFLYMEDGIPLRPLGVFNHNALIEMNLFAISNIEIIKGASSSLYGAEAVSGSINFITHKPTAIPSLKIGIQGDNFGYKRLQFGGGGMIGKKFGAYISGFTANQRNSWMANSDYDKVSLNARFDYQLTPQTKLVFSTSYNDYYSNTSGSVDSIAFYNRSYESTSDFTYRKVMSLRSRLSATHTWDKNSETTLHLFYRANAIGQNPSYGIRWNSGQTTARGEINDNSFYSRSFVLQHSTRFNFLDAKLLAGVSLDNSPNNYWSYQINLNAKLRPDGRSVEQYTVKEERPDLQISNYDANLVNTGYYTQFEINPFKNLKLVMGVRYDRIAFDFVNNIDKSQGAKSYQQFSPKIGATYSIDKGIGVYANYSRGFSPPSLTAIFRPKPKANPNDATEFYYNLEPAQFSNIEFGGWASFLQDKIFVDISFYQMNGTQELLSIRQPDNSTDFQSAGKTLHRGIEYGVTYKPNNEIFFRFGGTNAIHRFEEFILSTRPIDAVKEVNGKDMPQSPTWIANTEITYKPRFAKGLRLALEYQRVSEWYQNQINTVQYNDKGFLGARGISVLNFRVGFGYTHFKNNHVEIFANVMNLTNELYTNSATRGNAPADRTTFTPAAPRTIVMGLQFGF